MSFRDVAGPAGLDFEHTNGRAGELFVIEVKGSGIGWIDYDNDGDLDLYAVNGNNLPGAQTPEPPINHLYRNEGDGSFIDVTAETGVGDGGYGHGITAADYDNDGDQDIYIANYGPNVLYRNDGDGTFTDVTETAGVAGDVWSVSAAFCDLDNDGLLDLYVANYLVFDIESTVRLPTGPGFYDGEVDALYLNNGDGTFRDVTAESIGNPNGKGLGVVCFDYDDDGDLEVYVANDGVANLMYENNGDGTFSDVTLFSGTGVNGAGETEAGMGVDAGDYDNDGDMDLFVTNYKGESNTLMRNEGAGIFSDVTSRENLVAPSLPYVTFGTGFFDGDNDGDLDLFVTNGHTEEELPDHAQPDQIFANDGSGRFEDISAAAGPPFSARFVGRGAAFGDFDNDGDVDIVVSNKNGPLNLLQNETPQQPNWLQIRTVGTESNRDGIGARITVSAPGFERIRDVRSGYSMFSSSDLRVHFGLGDLESVTVNIRWPSGTVDTIENVQANAFVTVTEGSGEAVASPFTRIETHYEGLPEAVSDVGSEATETVDVDAQMATLRDLLETGSGDLMAYLGVGAGVVAWVNTQTEQRLESLLADDPADFGHLMELGQYAAANARFDAAIDAFARAVASDPDSPVAHAMLATAALRGGEYDRAVTAARRAMDLGDRSASIHLLLGRALSGLQRNDEAEAILLETIEQYPASVEARLDLGQVYFNSDNAARAVEVFREAVRTDFSNPESRYQLADAYRRLGDSEEYDQQMAVFGILETESAVFKGGMDRAAEIPLLEREIWMNPMFGRTRAYRQIALRYDELGDEENEQIYSRRARASELKDDLATAVEGLRRVLVGGDESAKQQFRQVNDLRLQLVAAMNRAAGYDLGRSADLVEQGHEASSAGDYDNALSHFRDALSHDPDNTAAYHGMARVFVAGNFYLDLAGQLARRSTLIDQSAESYDLWAAVLAAMGNGGAASDARSMVAL